MVISESADMFQIAFQGEVMPPVIDEKLCRKCGKCVEICPVDVFYGSKKGETPVVSYPDECWHECACVQDCPVEGAIKIRLPLHLLPVYK